MGVGESRESERESQREWDTIGSENGSGSPGGSLLRLWD